MAFDTIAYQSEYVEYIWRFDVIVDANNKFYILLLYKYLFDGQWIERWRDFTNEK